jgi:hypothetical protein
MSIEEIHVKNFYNSTADEFSQTRYRPWSCVENFLDTVPEGSIIGDIGCGNGKNMVYRTDCTNIGCDFSKSLVKICNDKQLNVIHHLSTPEKRKKAISELQRVTKKNGKILILVWALEQEKNSRRKFNQQANFVDWKDKQQNLLGKRYYYVFKKNELESLIENKGSIISSFYEKGNWGLILNN